MKSSKVHNDYGIIELKLFCFHGYAVIQLSNKAVLKMGDTFFQFDSCTDDYHSDFNADFSSNYTQDFGQDFSPNFSTKFSSPECSPACTHRSSIDNGDRQTSRQLRSLSRKNAMRRSNIQRYKQQRHGKKRGSKYENLEGSIRCNPLAIPMNVVKVGSVLSF